MISQKKRKQLYNAVSDPIMDVRIEIAKMCSEKHDNKIDGKVVEDLLYKLYMKAPEMALAIFESTKDK